MTVPTSFPPGNSHQPPKKIFLFWKILAISQFVMIILLLQQLIQKDLFNTFNGGSEPQPQSGSHSKSKLKSKTTIIKITKNNINPSKSTLENNGITLKHTPNLTKNKLINTNTNFAQPNDMSMIKNFQLQTNWKLLDKIRKDWLKPPSLDPYNISIPADKLQILSEGNKLHLKILKIFDRKRNGFFIEYGASDGVYPSNTLHLEQKYDWTGLLIEADPIYFTQLQKTHRKAWTMNACLALQPKEHVLVLNRRTMNDRVKYMRLNFLPDPTIKSQVHSKMGSKLPSKVANFQNLMLKHFEAHCFPLTSMLGALGQTLSVDYLSLNMERTELNLKALKTIPWNYVYIKVISVEVSPGTIEEIRKYLTSKNYKFIWKLTGTKIRYHEYIFVHKRFPIY